MMKTRARKRMLKKVAKRSQQIVNDAKPIARKAAKSLSSTSTSTISTLAGGAASLASLIGGVMAVGKLDAVQDLYGELRSLRRKETSTGTLIAIGAGVAVVASGFAFFFGTKQGMKLRAEAIDLAKPYLDRAKHTATEVREGLLHGTNHVNHTPVVS